MKAVIVHNEPMNEKNEPCSRLEFKTFRQFMLFLSFFFFFLFSLFFFCFFLVGEEEGERKLKFVIFCEQHSRRYLGIQVGHFH